MKKFLALLTSVVLAASLLVSFGTVASAETTVSTFNEIYVGEYTTELHDGMAYIVFAQVSDSANGYGILVTDQSGETRIFPGLSVGAEGKFGIALYSVPEGNYSVRAYAGEGANRVLGNEVTFTVGSADDYYTRVGNTITMGKVPGALVTDDAIINALATAQVNEDGVLSYGGATYAKVVANPYASDYAYTKGSTYYFEMVDLKWDIVSESATEIVIITKDIIGASAYNDEYANVVYADSTVKTYLESLRTLVLTEVQEGKVASFSLPTKALVEGMANKTALTSPFATASGIYTEDLAGSVGQGMYWLSDAGTVSNYASYVDFSGEINANGYGYMVNTPYIGVRAVATITK